MRIRSLSLLLILTLAFLTIGASTNNPNLIPNDAINITQLLPDPPTPNSEESQGELQELLYWQANRTNADVARCRAEVEFDVSAFQTVLGPDFDEQHCPKTLALMKKVFKTGTYFSDLGKVIWKRPRPPVTFLQLQPCVKTPASPTYPSGHSTEATTCAEVLAALVPEKRDALIERGREIGWDRVIAGVHYPSDVAAGRVLGHVIAQAIIASPAFIAQEDAAKAELEQLEAAPVH